MSGTPPSTSEPAPYDDSLAHLQDELAGLDLVLRLELERTWAESEGPAGEGRGLYVSDETVDTLLRTDGPDGDPVPGGEEDSGDATAGSPDSTAGTRGSKDTPADSAAGSGEPGDETAGSTAAPGDPDGGAPPGERGNGPRETSFGDWFVREEPADDPGQSRDGRVADERARERSGRQERWRVREQELLDRIDRHAAQVRRRERRSLDAGVRLRLVEVGDQFGLDGRARDAFVVALAPALDPRYETIYAYLQDDLTRKRPTVGFAQELLAGTNRERLAGRALFDREAPLRGHRLVELAGDPDASRIGRFVVPAERVVDFLVGGDAVAPELAPFTEVVHPEAGLADLVVDDGTAATLERLADEHLAVVDSTATDRGRAAGDDGGGVLACFHGPDGGGKRRAVEAACRRAGAGPVVRADAGRIPPEEVPETVRLLAREARLRGGVIHLTNLDALAGDDRATLETAVRALDGVEGPVFCSGGTPLPARLQVGVTRHDFLGLEFPAPGYGARRAVWAGVEGLPAEVDPAELAATFRLTRGEIEDALSVAESLAMARGEEGLTRETVYAGCRAQSDDELGSHARKIESHYGWEDIVLPGESEARLREVAARIRNEGRVYAEWGFEEKFSLGSGLAVLFTGASGTGKTMAAEVIADDTGLDLYKIDLSSVVSKYVGETEENLAEVFSGAAGNSAILLFDEADALFGQRSEVSDAHDRYANVETNYLLQRIEEYEGTVILTTNFEQNIDDAFQRRLHMTVEFPRPDATAREAIWRGVFPPATPLGELDFEFLASFELTGGNIKNAALTAAFLAASEDDHDGHDGEHVEMRHVVRALRRELEKIGGLVDPTEFGAYSDVVTDRPRG